MINVSISSGDFPMVLNKAILLYENSHVPGQIVYASQHSIRREGNESEILPGVPLTKGGIAEALGALAEAQDDSFDLMPEYVLSSSRKHLVWWQPSKNLRVFFDCKELGKRSNTTPHPALLFSVRQDRSGSCIWSVWALAESKRPNRSTILQIAPYFNVYDNGSICTGSAVTPDSVVPSSIQGWENAFFGSTFTHANGTKKRSQFKNGDYALWKHLLDGKFAEFPNEVLIPDRSLSQVLDEIKTATGGK